MDPKATCCCKAKDLPALRPPDSLLHSVLESLSFLKIGLIVSGIVDLSVTKLGSVPLAGRKRQGLRKLSTDLISEARDETAAQVNRIRLTFLGTTAFCLLSLLSPDSTLLGGSEKINVPLKNSLALSRPIAQLSCDLSNPSEAPPERAWGSFAIEV